MRVDGLAKGDSMQLGSFEGAVQKNREAVEQLKKNDFQEALNSFSAAMSLLPDDAHPTRARIACNIGHVLVRLQRYHEAISAFENARDLFRQLGERNEAAEQIANCGSVCRDMENWDLALEHYRTALAQFEETGHSYGIANQYSNMAFIQSQRGMPGESVRYFKMAKRIFTELGDATRTELCERNILALEPFLAPDTEPVICATSCCGRREQASSGK